MGRSRLKAPLWIFGGVVLLILLALGAWTLLHTRLFSATSVKVQGATQMTTRQVMAAAGLASEPPLISIDTSSAAAGVEKLPWVKKATVTLNWPHSVTISVSERRAVGAVAYQHRWLLIDNEGRILTAMKERPFNQPLVVPPKVPTAVPGRFFGNSAIPAAVVAGTLPPAFRSQVAAVLGHNDGTVTLQMTTPVTVMLGQATDLTAKYKDVASVIAGATLHPGDVLDVSVPQASTITGP